MGKLEGKIALITGGNSGIGLATAKEFVNEDVRAFVHKLLRRRKANAAIATSNESNFPFKLTHGFLLPGDERSPLAAPRRDRYRSARSLAFYASDAARARTDACSHIEPGTRARATIALPDCSGTTSTPS